MKAILTSTIAVTFLLLTSISFSQTTKEPSTKYGEIKFKLTQYMLSCQSMYYTILKEKDFKTKIYLANIGTNYYNSAYNEWITLQDSAQGTINETLRKKISVTLQGYEKVFRETDKFNDPMTALLMQFAAAELELKILPGLWDKP